MLLYQIMDCRYADAVFLLRGKQSPVIGEYHLLADDQIVIQRFFAGVAEVDKAFFIAFADNPQPVRIDVCAVQADLFAAANPAGEKNHQDRIIPGLIASGYRI